MSAANTNAAADSNANPGHRPLPSRAEVLGYLKDDVNWGRWGPDDQKGAVNMAGDTPQEPAGVVH